MEKKKTLVVNLYGGPGTGKSTMAGLLFSKLKNLGINCEVATEYAKDLTWQRSWDLLKNQVHVFGEQHRRVFTLLDQVDVIVTDAPILCSIPYSDNKPLHALIVSEYQKCRNFDVFLNRVKPYNPSGRSQTLEQAMLIDITTREVLEEVRGAFDYCDLSVDGVEESVDEIIEAIMYEL